MSLLNMMPEERIDSWRQRVPSRMDREDPFEGDHFDERPPTRLTFRDVSPPEARPSTRLGFFRAATPLFGRSSTPSSTRPASSMMQRCAVGKRRSFLSLLTRKRKRKEPEEIPRDPVRLNFFRSRYGYFPDSNAFSRPLFETYVNERIYHNQPLTYIEWDAVFLCFDISDKISMYTIIQWATWQATRIGAHKYIECSAATGEGMKEVIDDSGREAMRRLVGGQAPEEEVIPKKKRRFF
ncbi:hypothetical protein BFJ72_g11494 [Fusarium proliferatum]|uniref:Uncharacterized protein n=1 Tax=Gibberella intermedia TaxID=948311 RepID=A0A420SM84_GIBIN|nr:hypothetical protein BFJ72_g11494 [Fusarium proliferatum]